MLHATYILFYCIAFLVLVKVVLSHIKKFQLNRCERFIYRSRRKPDNANGYLESNELLHKFINRQDIKFYSFVYFRG